MIKIGLVCVTS